MPWLRNVLWSLVLLGLVAATTIGLLVTFPIGDSWDDPLPTSGPLDGRELVASQVGGRKLLPHTVLTLGFADGGFTAYAGCNYFDGGYEVRRGRVRTLQAMSTAKSCGQRDAQDDWYFDLIDGAKVTERNGRVTLRSGGTEIRFVPAMDRRAPDAIVGVTWMLDGWTDDGRPVGLGYRPRRGTAVRMSLSDRSGEVATPCGPMWLEVRHQLGALVATPYGKRAPRSCSPAQARAGRTLRAVLDGRVAVVRRGDELFVRRGTTELRFSVAH